MCEKYRMTRCTVSAPREPELSDIEKAFRLETARYVLTKKAEAGTALYALTRLIPRPCHTAVYDDETVYYCPSCSEEPGSGPYCCHCGQRICFEGLDDVNRAPCVLEKIV